MGVAQSIEEDVATGCNGEGFLALLTSLKIPNASLRTVGSKQATHSLLRVQTGTYLKECLSGSGSVSPLVCR